MQNDWSSGIICVSERLSDVCDLMWSSLSRLTVKILQKVPLFLIEVLDMARFFSILICVLALKTALLWLILFLFLEPLNVCFLPNYKYKRKSPLGYFTSMMGNLCILDWSDHRMLSKEVRVQGRRITLTLIPWGPGLPRGPGMPGGPARPRAPGTPTSPSGPADPC